MMKKIRLLFLLFLLLPANLFAASYRHLHIGDGLSSRGAYRLAKDSTGFMWFFTQAGIDRFDGTEFRHYTIDTTAGDNTRQLPTAIYAFDCTGTPWAACNGGDMYTYDRITDCFAFRFSLSDYTSGAANLEAFFFDQDNRMWACIASQLYYFDSIGKQLIHISGYPGGLVTSLLQTDHDTWYIGTQTHLYRLQQTEGRHVFAVPEKIDLLTETRVESLFLYGEKLYIGTFSHGAFVMDTTSHRSKSLACIPSGAPIRAISLTQQGRILVGTDGAGMYAIDPLDDLLIRQYQADEDRQMTLSGNTISDLFVDEYNCIWVATSTNGITIVDQAQPEIEWIRHEYMNRNSLISGHVNVIYEDSDGDLWYGTNTGISLYRTKEGRWTHYLDEKSNESNHPVVVLTLCEDKEKQVWAGGFGISTFRIDKRTGRVQQLKTRQHTDEKNGVSTDYIYTIHTEGNDVWLGGIRGALTRYHLPTGAYTYYDIECIGDIRTGNPHQHQLLLASCGGLGIFNTENGEVDWHNQFGNVTLHYPIRCLVQAADGVVWMATAGDGLIGFHPGTGKSMIYTTDNGLESNTVLSVLQDPEGYIWFTTDKNLYRLDTHTSTIIDMNEYVQTNGSSYNPNACLLRSDGHLLFGAATGAWEFSSHFRLDRQPPAQLLLTGFSLFRQEVKVDEGEALLPETIDRMEAIRLSHAANYFSITFSSVNYLNPMQMAYEYKLEGYDADWCRAGSDRMADYTNVPPGNYTFHLRLIHKFTHEVATERSLAIRIDKPFWASWWAWCIYLLLAAGLVSFILHYTRNRIEEHNAKEKIRSFIHLAHDIRIPVTLIKAPLSELEANENLSEKGRKSLSTALTNADKLFAMVTQLLDLQKADAQAARLRMERHNLCDYMQEKMTIFRPSAIQKGIELQLEADADMPDGWFDRNSMDKIMDNLLSNAIKYTEKGTVSIQLKHSPREWTVKIKDSGIGIPAHDQKHLFKEFYRAGNTINSNISGSGIGLVLTRRLVRLNQGKITFSSEENKGSSFLLAFPINEAAFRSKPNEPEEPVTKPEQEQIPLPATERETILLAEDNDDMRDYLTESLSGEYRVITTRDGSEALEQARELNPDIIVSDIIMPSLRGDEMCRILKSSMETSHIPVILLTALNDKENIIWGLEAGADDYITKPFDFAVLKVRIRNILQSREKLRRMILSAEVGLDDLNYTNSLDKEFLDKAIAIIETELANADFSINDFCRELGMSRTSAYNKIKTLTNQAPNDFIRIIRLNRAKELLRSKKYPIAEVAVMVGFSDAKYFSTSFKKQFGISPSKVE